MNERIADGQLQNLLGAAPGYNRVTRSFENEESLLRHQLKLLVDGSDVKRFHAISTLQTNTVAAHSHGVAMLCWLIHRHAGVKVSRELLLASLTHDLAECRVGDVPSTTKRALNIRETFGAIEDAVLDTAQMGWSLTKAEELVLKIADGFQGFLFCLLEQQMGNRRIDPALHNFFRYSSDYITQLHNYGSTKDGMGDDADRLADSALKIRNAICNMFNHAGGF